MQERKYKGGDVTVWRMDDGKIQISISCDDSWADDNQICGLEPGLSADLSLNAPEIADFVNWLIKAIAAEQNDAA